MTNLPIQHANLPQETGYFQGTNDEFSALKEEYNKAVKKLQNSDFANSPTAFENELKILKKLIKAAENQGLTKELESLKAKEQEIYTKIANSAVSNGSMPYYRPIIAGSLTQKPGNLNNISFHGDSINSFLIQKFDNDESVKKGINELSNAGINKKVIAKILNALKVNDTTNHISRIDRSAIHNIAQMKNVFAMTKSNEKSENDNPIKHLNEQLIESKSESGHPIKLLFRDGNLIYSTPIGGEPSKIEMMQRYKESLLEEEDDFLLNFASKYKNEEGKIDSNYVRVFIALRQAGVTKENLLNLIDSCIKEDGSLDREMLATIGELKKAGVLSKDIKNIIDTAKDETTGEIDKTRIENAKTLTQTIMSGNDVVHLLKKAKGNEEASSFIIKYADAFKDPEGKTSGANTVKKLVNIVEDKNGNMNENAMDIVNALFNNRSIYNEKNEIRSDEFIKSAFNLVNFVKKASVPKGMVDENAAEAIFRMCQNSVPVIVQYTILENCFDENKNINGDLARIAWNMVCDKEDTETILEILKSCHDGTHINKERAKEALELFDVYIPENNDFS